MQACASGLQTHSLVLALLAEKSLSSMQRHCTAVLPPEANSYIAQTHSRLDHMANVVVQAEAPKSLILRIHLQQPHDTSFATLSPI